MAVDLWARTGHEADSAPPCWGWGWGCALSCRLLSHSERLSVISPFLALFRSGEGFSPQPEVTEEGWKRQGRRREIWGWTTGLWLDLSPRMLTKWSKIWPPPPPLPPLLYFVIFNISLNRPPVFTSFPGSAPPDVFRLFAYEKKTAKTKNCGKARHSRGGIKEKKAPWGGVVKNTSPHSLPSFLSMITPLSWFFSPPSDHLPTKISHFRWLKKRPEMIVD